MKILYLAESEAKVASALEQLLTDNACTTVEQRMYPSEEVSCMLDSYDALPPYDEDKRIGSSQDSKHYG